MIELVTGAAPTLHLPAPTDPRAGWVAVTDGEYPSGPVREPAVLRQLPGGWLAAAQLHTRTAPVGSTGWAWFDASLVGSSRTAVNDVPSSIPDRSGSTTPPTPRRGCSIAPARSSPPTPAPAT